MVTCRSGVPLKEFISSHIDAKLFIPDLVILSPGPGNPTDFKLSETIEAMINRKIPMFGVCLGLQGLVEYFDGTLAILDSPMHGKPSEVTRLYSNTDSDLVRNGEASFQSAGANPKSLSYDILDGLPDDFFVARYHSLYGELNTFPKDLAITCMSKDGVVMGIQHSSMPIAAVQFHPESILTSPKHGLKIIQNALIELRSELY